jgi:hypothetical protein
VRDASHSAWERIGAVSLGTLFVVLGAIPLLKGYGQVMYGAIVLIAMGAPLIYRGLGYGLPPFLEGLLNAVPNLRNHGGRPAIDGAVSSNVSTSHLPP